MLQETEIFRRASLLSVLSEKKNVGSGNENIVKTAPKDTSYLCCAFFLFMGFMVVMPMVFIGTAANYWMFKFRNVRSDDGERTSLQSLYQSTTSVATAIPLVAFSVFSSTVMKNYDARRMTIYSLTAIFVVFLIFAMLTRINTDAWQLKFFIISMILQGIMNSAVAVYQVHSMTILAKFPNKFMKFFLVGQNGPILADILQILSISVTDSDSEAALIFFLTGAVMVATSICLSYGMKYSKIYSYYLTKNSIEEVTNEDMLTWSQMRDVAKLIWPILATIGISIFTLSCVHPAVTTLVQSRHIRNGGAWETKYFTPVTAFLLADVSCMLGTLVFIGRITKSNYIFWLGGMVIRMVISVGVIMLCNAHPRKHLPVVIHEDWQFFVFLIIFNATLGYVINVCFLSVRDYSQENQEMALKLLPLSIAVGGAVFSVNGVIVVKLL